MSYLSMAVSGGEVDSETSQIFPASKDRNMKKLTYIAILGALASAFVFAGERKSIFLDNMGGFEAYIEKAAVEQELNAEFIEEVMHPDLRVLLGKKFTSVAAEVHYKKATGRSEDSVFEVVDVKTGKVLYRYDFRMAGDDGGKKRIATDFVRGLKDKLK